MRRSVDRIGARPDDVLRIARVRLRRAARRAYAPHDRRRVEVEQVAELAQQARHAAGPVEVLHVVHARRLQVDQHRHLAAEPVELVEVDRDAAPPGDRGQVDQRVGRAADRLQHDQRVAERRRRHERRGRGPPLRPSPPRAARRLGRAQALGMHRGDRRRARQAMPIASAMHAIVLAVPITMQVPAVGASRPLTASISRRVDVAGAEVAPQAPAVGAGAEPSRPDRGRPASARSGRRSPERRPTPRAISCAGIVLSQPPISTTASIGCARIISSVSIAIRLRRYMLVGMGERLVDRDRRELHRQPAGQHHAALDRLDQLRHVAVAGIEVAVGVGDADDRPRSASSE